MQTNDLETNVLGPLHAWIKEYRTFKDKLSSLDNRRLEFDAERRAFHKLELKKVHQQQASDKAEPELMGKLEAKSGDVAGRPLPQLCECLPWRLQGVTLAHTHSCADVLGINFWDWSSMDKLQSESMFAYLCQIKSVFNSPAAICKG